jgi:hypothetical protein
MRVTVSSEQIQAAFQAVKDDPSFDESRGLWQRGHAPVEMAPGDVPAAGDPGCLRNAIPERVSRELGEHFSVAELVELTFLIGYINMLNLFNNALGVRYNGEYALLRSSAR